MAQVCSAALNVLPPGVLFIKIVTKLVKSHSFQSVEFRYSLHDEDSTAGGCWNVDVIQASAGATHQSQLFK